MNEQIRLLMKQAGTDTSGKWMGIDHAKKFAELIVQECMDIADEQKKWVEDMEVFNEQDATWNKARIQQSQQIVDKIKQHFGVEQ